MRTTSSMLLNISFPCNSFGVKPAAANLLLKSLDSFCAICCSLVPGCSLTFYTFFSKTRRFQPAFLTQKNLKNSLPIGRRMSDPPCYAETKKIKKLPSIYELDPAKQPRLRSRIEQRHRPRLASW